MGSAGIIGICFFCLSAEAAPPIGHLSVTQEIRSQQAEPFGVAEDLVEALPEPQIQAAYIPLDTGPRQDWIAVLQNQVSHLQTVSALGFVPISQTFKRGINGFAFKATSAQVQALQKDPRVRYVVPDVRMQASVQQVSSGFKRVGAHLNPYTRVDGQWDAMDVDIAILDTGVNHADINLYQSLSFLAEDKDPNDQLGHGTHVAGIAAAIDNGEGVVGIAPGARIWSLKVLDGKGGGQLSDVIAGLEYVLENHREIEVVNLSLGAPGKDDGNCGRTVKDPLHEIICQVVEAGVVVVSAAGNESRDAAHTVPAAYNEVITVSALDDAQDRFAPFSNYGADVDLVAPGVNILSTGIKENLQLMTGTSMAAPHVTGAVALLMARGWKPRNGTEALAVKDYLVSIGQIKKLAGDPDFVAEPVLQLQKLRPVQVGPSIRIRGLRLAAGFLRGQTLSTRGRVLPYTPVTIQDLSGRRIVLADRQGWFSDKVTDLRAIEAEGQVIWRRPLPMPRSRARLAAREAERLQLSGAK